MKNAMAIIKKNSEIGLALLEKKDLSDADFHKLLICACFIKTHVELALTLFDKIALARIDLALAKREADEKRE